MDLTAIRAFAVLARQRRFTHAARTLGVTQPSLSRQIQRLERELGAKLCVRAPDGVVLTAAGERFFVHVERCLRELDAGRAELAQIAGEPTGAVTLGTLATVGAYVLPSVIAAFHRRYPAVRLRVREGFRDALEAGVARGEIDLAIVQMPARREELTSLKLWAEDYLLAVPPGHRLARSRRAVALTDVATEPFVVIPGGTALEALDAACRARGVQPVVALQTDNVESVRRMVDAGLGLALVPRIMAADRRLWRGGLVRIEGGVGRRVAIVHRGAGYLSAAARALLDAIAAHARKQFGERSARGGAGAGRGLLRSSRTSRA